MDKEVGDSGLYLERSRRGDGAAANVQLNADIVDMGHIADFFDFCNASGVANIGLDYGEAPLFKEGPVAPAGEDTLAAGQRDRSLVCDLPKKPGVQRLRRLFIVIDVVLFQDFCQLDSRIGVRRRAIQ